MIGTFNPLSPQYPHTNFPNWPPYISLKNVLREFYKRSMQFHFGDYFIKIRITISLESIWISLGENWCWSPLGLLKGVKGVFERRTPTGSESFSVLLCLDDTKFGLLSVFTLLEMICLNVWAKPQLKNATKTTYGWRASLNVFASYIVLFCFCFCFTEKPFHGNYWTLLYRYWWNTRIFPFTKKSYLHRAQWDTFSTRR